MLVPAVIALQTAGAQTAGSLDPSFTAPVFGGSSITVPCIAVQPDGKIIVAGHFSSLNNQPHVGIARLFANGVVDTSFNASINSNSSAHISTLAIQPDGKILIGGLFTGVNGQARGNIARLLPDGSLESTATFNPGTGPDVDLDIIRLQPDGKILIAGDFNTVSGQARNHIARLLLDGALEGTDTFNIGSGPGQRFSNGPDGWVTAMELQEDGKILLGVKGLEPEAAFCVERAP